jgi:hypothetical protein
MLPGLIVQTADFLKQTRASSTPKGRKTKIKINKLALLFAEKGTDGLD